MKFSPSRTRTLESQSRAEGQLQVIAFNAALGLLPFTGDKQVEYLGEREVLIINIVKRVSFYCEIPT